ncbi:MAG: LOG family protein [Acidimicrobiia bacterium]
MSRRQAVAVFGSSQTESGSSDWDEAQRAGARLAAAGLDVVTGGYGGTMEAVSQGAAHAGGHVIGVTAPSLFSDRSGANPYVTEVIEGASLALRIGTMMQRSAASLALPGSIGTAAELIIAWNTNHILRQDGGSPIPAAAVGAAWKGVGRALVEEVGAFEGDIYWADSVDDGIDWITSALLPTP